jgi:hypothetical protein
MNWMIRLAVGCLASMVMAQDAPSLAAGYLASKTVPPQENKVNFYQEDCCV